MNFKSVMGWSVVWVATVANASASYHLSYDVTLDNDMSIENIIIFNEGYSTLGGGWSSAMWPNSVGGQGTTTLVDPFSIADTDVAQTGFMVGVTSNLPGDAFGQRHIVLMMSDDAAALAENIAWGTLFRNTLEDQLLGDLDAIMAHNSEPEYEAGWDGMNTFVGGDAKTGILDNLAQSHSAHFNMGDSFTVMAFSDGSVIGRGVSHVDHTDDAVPEPATMAILGSGLLAFARRRRRGSRIPRQA